MPKEPEYTKVEALKTHRMVLEPCAWYLNIRGTYSTWTEVRSKRYKGRTRPNWVRQHNELSLVCNLQYITKENKG